MSKPLVSINIPTFNSAKTLSKCLDSIKHQDYKDIEVIIIDSYSNDQTTKIGQDFGAKIFFADSLASARKTGIENSTGKYIFLVDSDQTLEPNTVSDCVSTCEEEGFDGVTLFERSLPIKNTLAQKIIAYDKWLFHSLADDDPIQGSAIPRFFKSEYLKRIDFASNPPITFEHSLIHKKIVNMGAKIKFVNTYINHHEPATFREVFKKFFRYGFYYLPALKMDRTLVLSHSLPRRAYFTKKAFTRPLFLLGLFYLYFVKSLASSLGATKYLLDKILRRI